MNWIPTVNKSLRPSRHTSLACLRLLLTGASLLINTSVMADGIDALHTFVRSTHAATANFTQDVYDRHHKLRQHATGTLAFARPGHFRWVYGPPVDQTIVGDGKELWLYESGLNQVTERKLDHALGSSPAALLAGDNNIDRYFKLQNNGTHDGLDWLIAIPQDSDSTFHSVQMGFQNGMLMRMIIEDNFGSTTDLTLSHLQRNPALPNSTFVFTPPADADVISDLQ